MSTKFGASYVLNVQGVDLADIEIKYPLTLEFDITRASWSSQGNCTLRIRNLNLDTNKNIYKDWYQPGTYFRSLKLTAGYGESPYPTIFNGNIWSAYFSKDSGSTDVITEITGWDFGYVPQTSYINTYLQASPSNPLPQQIVVNTLVNTLVNTPKSLYPGNNTPTGISIGYVSKTFNKTYPRGRTLLGSTWNLLQQETGGKAFIDNGKINILDDYYAFGGAIFNIDADTGLLSTPRRTQTFLDIDILFEPNINPGQLVNLVSQSVPIYNGQYQVMGLEHRGIISGSVNGRRTTKLRLRYGSTSSQGGTGVTQFQQVPNTGLPAPTGVTGSW